MNYNFIASLASLPRIDLLRENYFENIIGKRIATNLIFLLLYVMTNK